MKTIQVPEIARVQAALICEQIPYLEATESTVLADDKTYGEKGWSIDFRHPIQGKICALTQYEQSGILRLVLYQSSIMKLNEGKLRQLSYPIATATNKQLLAQEIA